jgi:hypothetical protein
MTELAVTMEQLIDAVKGLSIKLDKLQDEKVQSLSERLAVAEERLNTAHTEAKKVPVLVDQVNKLQRTLYGVLAAVGAQLIGLVIWLVKK